MSADRGKETELDEQYETQRAPVEREFANGEDGGETARDATGIAGLSFGLIIAIIFILFVVVLLGFIIANAL
jgi:hypothetical protein